jgi:hypothetical protein
MASHTVTITAVSVNYTFPQHPVTVALDCSKVEVIGIRTISAYNAIQDLERQVLFVIAYRGVMYGLKGFKTFDSFMSYLTQSCADCSGGRSCAIEINNCLATINGCYFFTDIKD